MEAMKTALLELTSQICKVDGFRFKHAMILQNTIDETAEAIGILTTRALYKNGRNSLDRDEDAFSGYDTHILVNGLVYKFVDDAWVQQTGKVFPYATYSTTNECNSIKGGLNYLANYKIVWSNYPLLYAGELRGVADEEEKTKYNKNKLQEYYKLSDEPFTLDMAPHGTPITMGRYKVGASEILPLTWGVAEYTENFTKLVQDTDGNNIYGENKVVLSADRVVDILPVNNKKDYTNSLAWGETSEIMKYLNSSSPNNWWYEAFEGDTPDDRGYFPEGGFLRHFNQQELQALQEVRTRRNETADLIRGKVHLPSTFEIASTTKCKYADNWSIRAWTITYLGRPRYHELMAHHPISPQKNFTSNVISYWKRDMPNTNGNQLSGTSSTSSSSGDTATGIVPCIYLSGEQKVNPTPNENGYFELIYPELEAFDIDYIYETKRKIIDSVDSILNTSLSLAIYTETVIETARLKCYQCDTSVETKRKTYIFQPFITRLIRLTKRKLVKESVRNVRLKRKTIKYAESILHTKRKLMPSLFDCNVLLNTSRKLLQQYNVILKSKRKKEINSNYIIKAIRKTTIKASSILQTKRKAMIYSNFTYSLELNRKTICNQSLPLRTKRKSIIDTTFNFILDAKRKIVVNYNSTLYTKRQIIVYTEFISDVIAKRKLIADNISSLNTKRLVICDTKAVINTVRKLVINNSTDVNTKRALYLTEYTELPAVRQLLTQSETEIVSLRKVIDVVDVELETKRQLYIPAFASECILNTNRQLLEQYETEISTKRDIMEGFDVVLDTVRIVKMLDKKDVISLLRADKVKNSKGISNIQYNTIGVIKGRYYPVKTAIEPTPIGLDAKVKYLLITSNKLIKAEHYVSINGVIYAIDMITKYSTHKEVYLKEL